jgi:hypothetical protein
MIPRTMTFPGGEEVELFCQLSQLGNNVGIPQGICSCTHTLTRAYTHTHIKGMGIHTHLSRVHVGTYTHHSGYGCVHGYC